MLCMYIYSCKTYQLQNKTVLFWFVVLHPDQQFQLHEKTMKKQEKI